MCNRSSNHVFWMCCCWFLFPLKRRQKVTTCYLLYKFPAVIYLLLFTLELAGFENEKDLESFGIDPFHCVGFVGGIRGFLRAFVPKHSFERLWKMAIVPHKTPITPLACCLRMLKRMCNFIMHVIMLRLSLASIKKAAIICKKERKKKPAEAVRSHEYTMAEEITW